ncbi:hypothetical protein ACIRL3_24370 [Streptomyces sp. NPDC102384]|uniref:hypothetical protein n=1 Tax=Streptomyces sp. NPDC102384 TaxID=3366166 RepID=UPI0037F6DAC0
MRFTASGRLVFIPSPELRRKGRAVARAEARLALDALARDVTRKFAPVEYRVLEEELALAVSEFTWVKDHPEVQIKARLALSLSGEDRNRSQTYEDAVRAERLRHAQEWDRLSYLRATVLAEPALARTWWLEQQRDQLAALTWQQFNDKVLPSVADADDAHARALQVAEVLAEVVEQLGDDPGRHKRFLETTRWVLQEMGWATAADRLPAE